MLRNKCCSILVPHGPRIQPPQQQKEYVPLKKVSVEATIRSFAADVTIKQVFCNNETQPIEAVYCFPIEEQAAVYAFTAKIDDREIVAELKEKKEAQQEYVDALKQGHGAYLLEQNEKSQDNFIINVGALPPGKECHISISYVSELDIIQNGRKIRFVLPTTIAPRYDPGQHGISSPAGTTSKYVQSTPYTIQYRCQVEKIGIARVSSSSHPIQVDFSQTDMYTIEFARENTHLDRDILLDLDLVENRSNTIVAVETGAVMASFTPTDEDCRHAMNDTTLTNEFVFVVDCSGSMRDENKIGLARQSLLLFLKSLPVSCHFNIIRFGSHHQPLFPDITTVYNEENMRKAEQFTKQMQADLGGTELLKPLEWLENNRPKQGHSRQVFLLTDGEISNVDAVLDLCRCMSASTRIFSFGLGNAPSRSLVKGLARATHGRFVFIPPNENVDIYVGEQLQKALQPSITNIQVKWNMNTSVISAPTKLPPVYANDRLIVYALNTESASAFDQNSTVELYRDQQRLSEARIERVPSVSHNGTIARLAAKALILELQHAKAPRGNIEGSLQSRFKELRQTSTTNNEQETTKKKIIELSLKYKILSPYTAFIGVEKRADGSNAGMILREVPIEISADDQHLQRLTSSGIGYRMPSPGGRGGRGGRIMPAVQCMSMASPAPLSNYQRFDVMKKMKMSSVSPRSSASSSASSSLDFLRINKECASAEFGDDVEEKNEIWPTSDQDIVRLLINKQKFDGLWELDATMIERLSGKPMASFNTVNKVQVFFSALIVFILETRFASLSAMWYGVVQKARQRLLDFLDHDNKQLESLMENIRQQL